MHSQRGASMVEFAIASMAMLLLIFGIIEFAQLVYSYHTVAQAARLGTRWAIVRGNNCVDSSCPAKASDVQTYVRTQVPLLTASSVSVSTTWANTTGCTVSTKNGPGCTVTVQVSYPFSFALPWIWASNITLSSSSTMVISE